MNKYEQITNIQERRRAFLDDTVAFYNSNNRAVIEGPETTTCVYQSTDNSPGCAIGRHLDPSVQGLLSDCTLQVTNPLVHVHLPKWMMEMGLYFLVDIQSLHDSEYNWGPNGLTASGRQKVALIKEKYL